ncbi:GNAT family N-acetyltransferase [Micromonospora sp. LOL_023]|uniref:GNAT family N-acetyltransferase n=1 Tax=Micromonospora sp. LOL_023 TaxID=3345418 RepID=UPI003A8BD1A9
MPELIAPTIELYASWLDARDEWGRGTHQDGSGLRPADDVDTAAGFAAWVDRLRRQGDESLPADEGWVHTTHRWIIEQDAYLGAISLRHRLNDFLRRAGGHIGYGVRPSVRGRGIATWALGAMLPLAAARGLDRVMVTCDESNPASARVIERNGGVLEDVRDTELGRTRRYWIDLGEQPRPPTYPLPVPPTTHGAGPR